MNDIKICDKEYLDKLPTNIALRVIKYIESTMQTSEIDFTNFNISTTAQGDLIIDKWYFNITVPTLDDLKSIHLNEFENDDYMDRLKIFKFGGENKPEIKHFAGNVLFNKIIPTSGLVLAEYWYDMKNVGFVKLDTNSFISKPGKIEYMNKDVSINQSGSFVIVYLKVPATPTINKYEINDLVPPDEHYNNPNIVDIETKASNLYQVGEKFYNKISPKK